eukprot:4226560-Amphidinium_carterae.1
MKLSVPDEALTVQLVLAKPDAKGTAVAADVIRPFSPVAAALAATVLNGHKAAVFPEVSAALGAPFGCLAAPLIAALGGAGFQVWNKEVRFLTAFGATFLAAWESMDRSTRVKTAEEFATIGVTLVEGVYDSWDLASRTPALDAAVQLARAMTHMAALSVAGGKHHV